MAQSNWEFGLDGKPHSVQFEHTYFSGRRKLIVDGVILLDTPGKLLYMLGGDLGGTHDFQLSQRKCSIWIGCNGFTYSYNLLVDGLNVDAISSQHSPIPEP